MKRSRILLALSVSSALAWGGYLVYRAHMDLVTLRVRNMDVRKVVSKMEWQTWESILVNKEVFGTVTLDVKNVPLEEALEIVALQTGARWTALFPIYSGRKSARAFEKVVRGELPAAGNGWSNYEKNPSWKLGGGPGFGGTLRAENKVVSAQFDAKDLDFASLALSRFSRARVVPEDGAKGTVNLKLEQVPLRKAVAKVAGQVHRDWDQIYALQPLHPGMLVRKEPLPPGAAPEAGAKAVAEAADTNRVAMKLEKAKLAVEEKPGEREREMEAFLATMTLEERRRTQEQMASMEQIRSLPPAEQQERMKEMAAQATQASGESLEQRINNRLKNGTTDQRIAHDRLQLGRQQRPDKQ